MDIPWTWKFNTMDMEIRLKLYQIHVGTTYLKLILAIGAVYLP